MTKKNLIVVDIPSIVKLINKKKKTTGLIP